MTDADESREHSEHRRRDRDAPLRREDFVSVVVDNEEEPEERPRSRRRPRPPDDRRENDRRRRERPSSKIEVEIDGALVRIPPGADRSSLWTVFDLLRERGSRR
jgi:hypothetical protein